MPEGLDKGEQDFSWNLNRKKLRKLGFEELSQLSGVKYVGSGVECVVIETNDKPYRVTAFRYAEISPDKTKSIFYLQRIFSTLFPHNFPHFYSSFTQNTEKRINAGTIRQKIQDPIIKQGLADTIEGERKYFSNIKYPFETARKVIGKFVNQTCFDECDINFGVGPDGGEYYLDTPVFSHNLTIFPEKIIDYMCSNLRQDGKKYTDHDLNTVVSSVVRLDKLGKVKIS